jgi:hypothetical protein
MRVRNFHLSVCCAAILAGCAGPSATTTESGGTGGSAGGGDPPGTGRFTHSAIRKTIAPWDGPATELVLSETPLDEARPTEPHVSIRIYGVASDSSRDRIRLEGKEPRKGEARWVERGGKSTPLAWAEIHFAVIREGEPVTGTYDVAFADGRRERGHFRAKWLAPEGRGG